MSEPPTILGTWMESIAPVFGPVDSKFASSISLDINDMWSVGAPEVVNENNIVTGGVFTSRLINDSWTLIPAVYGENADDRFGMAIDMFQNKMIVGAPMSLIPNTTTPSGAAYYYSYDETSMGWDTTPFEFRSGDDILSTNGEFGKAVALGVALDTQIPRVIIGAPKSNLAVDAYENGRVYTYQATSNDEGTTWSALETNPIVGKNAYDWFGYSVDMTADGLRFIVGAPGSNSSGYFQIYEWDGTQWNIDFEEVGTPGEAFGSYVTIISDNIFAIGGPGYENGSGRVVVYKRSSSLQREATSYVLLGEPIIGSPGDRLGTEGSIAGGKHGNEDELILIVASAVGTIETYALDEVSGAWKPNFEPLSTGKSSTVVVEYSTSTGLIVGYPEVEEVSFFDSVIPVNTTTDNTATPVISPTDLMAPPTSSPTIGNTSVAVPTSTIVPTPYTVTTNATTSAPSSILVGTNAPIGTNTTTEPPIGQDWILVADTFTPQTEDGSDFGSSVSISPSTMVIGSSMALGNGAAFVYTKNSTTNTWTTDATQQLFGATTGVEYGSAVAVTSDSVVLAISAPRTIADGTLTEFGAVYCYTVVNGQYESLGLPVRGNEDIYSASEMFGASIAVANTGTVSRIAIGAPFNNFENILLRGMVYVYDYSSTTSSWTRVTSMTGQVTNSVFGTSIDMSDDGSILLIGAPGTNYAEIYAFDGSQWNSVYNISSSDTTTTGFGTSVLVLTNDIVAVGDPSYNGNVGRVVVYYNDQASGSYLQLGSDIVGTVAGEQFGTVMTSVIGENTLRISIVIGTVNNGSLLRFDYDSTSATWVQHTTFITTTFGSSITSIASSSIDEIVVTGSQNAAIYQWS
jgi:hypothetical protein